MDPLHVAIALGPLATYLLVLGVINLSSRPLLDHWLAQCGGLAIAMAGLMVVGRWSCFSSRKQPCSMAAGCGASCSRLTR